MIVNDRLSLCPSESSLSLYGEQKTETLSFDEFITHIQKEIDAKE